MDENTKLTLEISSDAIIIKIDDEPIGAVQECDINIVSEPRPTAQITIRRWKKVGDDTVLTVAALKEMYKGVQGVYIMPFTDNMEQVTDTFTIVETGVLP